MSLKTVSGLASVRKTTLILAALVFVVTLSAGQAQAVEFAVIIANLDNAKTPHAQIDVSVSTEAMPGHAPSIVLFTMFAANGEQFAQFEVMTNRNGFASSSSAPSPYDNLFTVSGGLPSLVWVSTPPTSSEASAVLRQTSKESDVALNVPPVRKSDGATYAAGIYFPVAIGDIIYKETLLIANLSGSDVEVDIFIGPGVADYINPRIKNNAFWIVDLDPAVRNSHAIVRSTGAVIVQLAVNNDQKGNFTEVMAMPIPQSCTNVLRQIEY